jgi:hypothetical protein
VFLLLSSPLSVGSLNGYFHPVFHKLAPCAHFFA